MTRTPVARASKITAGSALLDPARRIHVSIVVRSRIPERQWAGALHRLSSLPPGRRKYLSLTQLDRIHSAPAQDLRAVERFGEKHGLQVIETDATRHVVVFQGTLQAFEEAFKIRFVAGRHDGVLYRTYSGDVQIPSELRSIVKAVLGLNSKPEFDRKIHVALHPRDEGVDPREVAGFYGFPADVDGSGQNVAIIELGGGFHFSDIHAYCARLKIRRPNITVVEIDGQKNAPASRETIRSLLNRFLEGGANPQPSDKLTMWTIEATMDVELAAALANGANIVVYFAPNTPRGKYQAISEALRNREYPASVITCSWSSLEDSPSLTPDTIRAMESLFQRAALQGVTVCCSSGDDGVPNVHYPASSPWVLACGGTHLRLERETATETPWKERLFDFVCATSGGASQIFDLPSWQRPFHVEEAAGRTGRGVPDVAAKADIRGGYRVVAGGQTFTMGGTSAAAPAWASLVARLNQKFGTRLGFINPILYSPDSLNATARVVSEEKGHRRLGHRWQPGTGLGSPRGDQLLSVLERYIQDVRSDKQTTAKTRVMRAAGR